MITLTVTLFTFVICIAFFITIAFNIKPLFHFALTVAIAPPWKRHPMKKNTVYRLIIFICSFIMVLSWLMMQSIAEKHGMTNEMASEIKIQDLYSHIKTTPPEDSLPVDTRGIIVLYYRFDCPDCATIFPELQRVVQDRNDVYWVSTRSKQGQTLREKFPVEEVPSAIYIKQDGKHFIKKILLNIDENGKETLDTENLNRLFKLQKGEKDVREI